MIPDSNSNIAWHRVQLKKNRDAVKALPHGKFEWIEGGGHVVMEEGPERVNALLLEFLQHPHDAPITKSP